MQYREPSRDTLAQYLCTENQETFLLNLAAAQNHMGFPDHVSGYTIILSSSAKFLCLHTQEQEKYFFPFCHSPQFVVTGFSQISCFKPCCSQWGWQHLLVWQANALSSLRSNSNPNCYATSLYIVKAYKALPSLNCHLRLHSCMSLISQRKERKLLHCSASLKYTIQTLILIICM